MGELIRRSVIRDTQAESSVVSMTRRLLPRRSLQ